MSIYDWDLLNALSASPTGDYLSIYSTFSLSDNSSVYNANLWGGGGYNVDFTCVGHRITPSSTLYCKLAAISKRHAIRTEHSAVASDVGQVYGWIARDGTLESRTIIDTAPFAAGTGNAFTDFQIVYLDSDLPTSITPVKLFNDSGNTMSGEPVIRTNQFRQAMTATGALVEPNIGFFQPGSSPLSLYWGDWVGNDSGSPAFYVNGGKLIYMTSAVSTSSGPACRYVITELLAACAALDAANDNTGYVPSTWNPAALKAARSHRLLAKVD